MSRLRVLIELLLLAALAGLIIWHTSYWHATGEHERIFLDIQEGKELAAIAYNLGLMLLTGATLGLLFLRLGDALGLNAGPIEHFGPDETASPGDDEVEIDQLC